MLSHTYDVLSSGLPVIRIPMPSVESVTVLALVNTGSRYEKPREYGIAHFFEHMVFKGTQSYPDAQALASAVDSVGADFNAFTSKEYTGYYVKSASKDIRLALDVVSDMLMTPTLRQEDIDREKGVIIEEMNMYADIPARHINNLFDQMMFQGSGLGHDIIGTKESVCSLLSIDFQSFLQQWYGNGNMLLVLAGDDRILKKDETLKLASEMFEKETSERIKDKVKLERYMPEQPLAPFRLRVEYKDTEQAHFVLGWPGLKRNNPDRYALSLLSTIIGGNMSSRLFTEIREKRGLCYYIHADTDMYHDTGLLGGAAGVDPKRVEEAVKVTIAEFEDIVSHKKPITSSELQKAKDYIAGKMLLGFEDSESVAQYFGMRQLLSDDIETPEQVLEKVRAVELDELASVAEKLILPGEMRFAVIGPFKDPSMFEKLTGATQTMAVGGDVK
ncbi:MAG: insulinase family protein [bacterium]|nr:insulinase family protein [bacterium]